MAEESWLFANIFYSILYIRNLIEFIVIVDGRLMMSEKTKLYVREKHYKTVESGIGSGGTE